MSLRYVIAYNDILRRGYKIEVGISNRTYEEEFRIFGRTVTGEELMKIAKQICWKTSPEVSDEIEKRYK